MSYSPDPVRAGGPAVVTEGTPDGPIVLVLDPGGEAKHDGLPATWRDELDSWLVIWCRVPSAGGLSGAEEFLTDQPGNRKTVHVLASGLCADEALRLAEAHTEAVRSVLLVDPGASRSGDAGDDVDDKWEQDNQQRRWALTRSGVDIRVVAHSSGGERDRIPAPLPLGHPEVVTGVKTAIGELT